MHTRSVLETTQGYDQGEARQPPTKLATMQPTADGSDGPRAPLSALSRTRMRHRMNSTGLTPILPGSTFATKDYKFASYCGNGYTSCRFSTVVVRLLRKLKVLSSILRAGIHELLSTSLHTPLAIWVVFCIFSCLSAGTTMQ